ncbi:MAG: hypothetical protein ACFFDJ_09915 [Candidatus Odinarchaeota archaeon]
MDFRKLARIIILIATIICIIPLALSILATANLIITWWEFIVTPIIGFGLLIYLGIAIVLVVVILILNIIIPLIGFFRIHYENRERFAIIFLFIAIITFFFAYLFWELWLGRAPEILPIFSMAFAPYSYFLMIFLIAGGIVYILASILTILIREPTQ